MALISTVKTQGFYLVLIHVIKCYGSNNSWVCTELLMWIHFVWTRPRLQNNPRDHWLNSYATDQWRSLENTDSRGWPGERSIYLKRCVRTGLAWIGQIAPNYFLSLIPSSSISPTLALHSPFPISVHVCLPPEGNVGTTGGRCKTTCECQR